MSVEWIILARFFDKNDKLVDEESFEVYAHTKNEAEKKAWKQAEKLASAMNDCDWFWVMEVE